MQMEQDEVNYYRRCVMKFSHIYLIQQKLAT